MKAIKIPCEHDLLSKDNNVWVNAVMRCKGHNPYCGSDGYCNAGGKCFVDQEMTREQAILEVDRLAQELHEERQLNEVLKASAQSLVNVLEISLEQNLKKERSERVFAIRYCIGEIKRFMKP